MRVCGIDPGATTGLAMFIDGNPLFEWETRSLSGLYRTLCELEPEVIVIEDFLGHRAGPAQASSVFKAIGVCELFVEERPKIKMVFSNPSILQGKRKPTRISPHVWSASVHALHYIGSKNG